jgi:hypothetical protein
MKNGIAGVFPSLHASVKLEGKLLNNASFLAYTTTLFYFLLGPILFQSIIH